MGGAVLWILFSEGQGKRGVDEVDQRYLDSDRITS